MGQFGLFGDTVRVFFSMCFDPVKRVTRFCVPRARKTIKGEIVLITGSGRGLGRALALRLAEFDPVLVLWDINEDENNLVAEEIQKAGHVAYSYRVDVTNQEEVIEAANRVREEVGDVTLLINNAGVFSGQPIVDLPAAAVRLCFEVNVLAHFWILQQFLPNMLLMDRGHIVSIASMAGHTGVSNMTGYCASKYAAVGLMESLQVELRAAKKKRIKFTTVNPVIITTGLIPNVKSRFPSLAPLLDVKKAAKRIVNSILSEEEEVFVPKRSQIFLSFVNCFTGKTRSKILDYIDYGFDPEEKLSDGTEIDASM